MAGPCSCENNVETAFKLGIALVILSLVYCVGMDQYGNRENFILSGLIEAMINGLLVYGADNRNSTAIAIWIILASADLGGICIFIVLVIIQQTGDSGRYDIPMLIAILGLYAVILFFTIWSIIIAIGARKEIKEEQQRIERK